MTTPKYPSARERIVSLALSVSRRMSSIESRRYSRRSRATWSFRLLAGWGFPPIFPTRRGRDLSPPQPPGQARLHRHVNVLLGKGERDLPRLDLLPDSLQGGCDPVGFPLRDDLLFPEHPHMHDASLDVVPVEENVVGDRSRELLDERVDLPVEPAAPRFLLLCHPTCSCSAAST